MHLLQIAQLVSFQISCLCFLLDIPSMFIDISVAFVILSQALSRYYFKSEIVCTQIVFLSRFLLNVTNTFIDISVALLILSLVSSSNILRV